MTDTLTDAQFLDFCEQHASTPVSGFTPAQMERLYRLMDPAKYEVEIALCHGMPDQVVEMEKAAILFFVAEARRKL